MTRVSDAHHDLNMPSHQLQMYDHTIHLDKLLFSDQPVEDIIVQTGQIVVNEPTLLLTILSNNIQKDAVAVVRSAIAEKIPMHVPALLLSASVEFHIAYRPGGNQTPQLTRICENDKRLKSNFWYQPMLYVHSGSYNSAPQSLTGTDQV
jgi:hypothetical protein